MRAYYFADGYIHSVHTVTLILTVTVTCTINLYVPNMSVRHIAGTTWGNVVSCMCELKPENEIIFKFISATFSHSQLNPIT